MKALFYLLDGDSNASSYHRVVQYIPLLRAHGIDARVARPVPRRLYDRLVERGRGLSTKAPYYALFAACRSVDVLRARRADVVVIQRDLFPFGPPILEQMLFKRNPRLVYDTDDATYLRPAFTPNTPFQRLRRFDKVAEVLRHARWVSVATEPIAQWARTYNRNVSVVPMAVDLGAYDAVRQAPRQSGAVTLGWAGTAGGLRYLESLAPVLGEVTQAAHARVRLVSGGYQQARLDGVAFSAEPWSGIAQLGAFDIGLVPLNDSPFERAKFPFKLLQYMALGIPVVAARVGIVPSVVEHGRNGLLASTAEEWREGLCQLIGDADLRRRLGDAGRQTVQDRYTIERIGPLLAAGLLEVAR